MYSVSVFSMETVDPTKNLVKSEAEIGKILIKGRLVPTLAACLNQNECGLDLNKINERQQAIRLDAFEDPAIDIINLQNLFIEISTKEKDINKINNSFEQAKVLLNSLINSNSITTYEKNLTCYENTVNFIKHEIGNGSYTVPIIKERIIGLKSAAEKTRNKIIRSFSENNIQITAEQLDLLPKCVSNLKI